MAAADTAMDNARYSEFKANLLSDLLVPGTKAPETLNAMYTRPVVPSCRGMFHAMAKEQCWPPETTAIVALGEDAETEAAVIEDAVAGAVLVEVVLDAAPAQKIRSPKLLLQPRRRRSVRSPSHIGAAVNKVTDYVTVPRTMDPRLVMAKSARDLGTLCNAFVSGVPAAVVRSTKCCWTMKQMCPSWTRTI